MLIGELSERSGLSRDTIRYYEKRGLVNPPHRKENNYKEYPEDTIPILLFIKQLQGRGFTLSEVQRFLSRTNQKALTCSQAQIVVQHKLDQIDRKIAALQASRERLVSSFSLCESKSSDGVCTPFQIEMAR